MRNELLSRINDLIRQEALSCSVIKKQDAEVLIEKLAETFHLDLSRRYLWEMLDNQRKLAYGESNVDWEKSFYELVQNFEADIYLAITDDEFYPWPILLCKKDNLIDLLKELEYFEFFIFDKSTRCILFDTHENEIIFAQRTIG